VSPIRLEPLDLFLASALVLLDAGLSVALGLRIHRQVLWAAVRMVVQLVLVGYVLRFAFALGSAPVVLGIVVLMLLAAAREVAVRPAHRLRGAGNFRIGIMVVGMSTMATVLLALFTAIRPLPWYDPHYVIPLTGIILGNVLNAASLGLDTFFAGVLSGRAAIEARLALGSNVRKALAPHIRDAIRKGQMSAAGIITLPGIMTGQILAGMGPMEAVKYQILLMFLLAGGSGLAVAAAVFLAARAVTDERQRLRIDRLTKR